MLAKNIMIVEDEVITQRYLKDILGQYDVSVIKTVDNGTDALQALKDQRFDIVLMDINIKGAMDGIQLSKNILERYVLPIVFITAYSDDRTLDEALAVSPYGFITKPFSEKDIVITLQVAYKRFLAYEKQESATSEKDSEHQIKINQHFSYSLTSSILYCDERPVKLNIRQNILIKVLCKNINNTVSKETLMVSVWQEEDVSISSLRNLVYSVRKILPGLPLTSHSKMGYSIESIGFND
ncbi:two-component hybrid sensor and regulator [hydrothermal vent metagenome]|uniref:Two-component hybrid sensor and regulator n=1 Tax=hydrothermal vent metagenome TaxID=652676 RepID=A0A1W1CV53_9ZZZZ